MAKQKRKTSKGKTTKAAAQKSARKTAAKKSVRKASAKRASGARRHEPTPGVDGWITHTDLASADPRATKAWCAAVFGWHFKPDFPMPNGTAYHLFAYSDQGGGGIRGIAPDERPSSVPYVHVADVRASFEKALREGAVAVQQPDRVMEGVTIAVVRAPGGVVMGIAGP